MRDWFVVRLRLPSGSAVYAYGSRPEWPHVRVASSLPEDEPGSTLARQVWRVDGWPVETVELDYAWTTDDLDLATAVALAYDGVVVRIDMDGRVVGRAVVRVEAGP